MDNVRSVEESVKEEDSESSDCGLLGGDDNVERGEEKFTSTLTIENLPLTQVCLLVIGIIKII